MADLTEVADRWQHNVVPKITELYIGADLNITLPANIEGFTGRAVWHRKPTIPTGRNMIE